MFSASFLCALVVMLAGCKQPPEPKVALAYAKQFGAVESSRLTPCPKVKGVWQLSQLSAGSLLNEQGMLVEHFRWVAPKLFGLTIGTRAYIAMDEQRLSTVLFLSDKIPGPNGQNMMGYTAKSDHELPCLGHGWRQVVVINHSTNDAAARVLGLDAEKPKTITQTDYFARSPQHDLLLAIQIEFQGTNAKSNPVQGGYWHFLKMPRLHDEPLEQGFKYP